MYRHWYHKRALNLLAINLVVQTIRDILFKRRIDIELHFKFGKIAADMLERLSIVYGVKA